MRGSYWHVNLARELTDHKISPTYKFDGDLLIVEHVSALEENTERAFTNLLPDTIVHANHVRGGIGCHFVGGTNDFCSNSNDALSRKIIWPSLARDRKDVHSARQQQSLRQAPKRKKALTANNK